MRNRIALLLIAGLFLAASVTPVAGFMDGGDIIDLILMPATPG